MENYEFCVLGYNQSSHDTFLWQKSISMFYVANNIKLTHNNNSTIAWASLNYVTNTNLNDLKLELSKFKKIIISDLLHYDDTVNDNWLQILTKLTEFNVVVLTNNRLLSDIVHTVPVVFYDLLFNRSKLYYFDKQRIDHYESIRHTSNQVNFDSTLWLYSGNDLFYLNDISKTINKHYVSPTATLYTPFRQQFVNYMIERETKGLVACPPKGKHLAGDKFTVEQWYCPLPSYVYSDSFASIYTETTWDSDNILHVTEKTFEPLIHGNFILPYSNPGFVNNLKTHYGFKLCELIDYTYDLPNINRSTLFLNSIDKFLEIQLTTLIEYANDRIDILAHNRELFVTLPYSELKDIF